MDLQAGLLTQTLERRGADALGAVRRQRRAERSDGRDVLLAEAHALGPGDSGDEREMVVGESDRVTVPRPATEPAVRDRLGIRARETIEQSFAGERLQPPVVGEELADAVRDSFAGSEYDVHVLRADALKLLEQVGVEAQLDEEVGLGPSRELGIEDLVAERAEGGGGAIDAFDKVGKATPVAVDEGGLVHDVGPAEHRVAGRLGGPIKAR